MICLRCGYCCKNYCVVILVDPVKGIEEDNLKIHEGKGEPCMHLQGNIPGKYSCAIHDKPIYKETPCHKHGQIEARNMRCRLGLYVLKNHEKKNVVS